MVKPIAALTERRRFEAVLAVFLVSLDKYRFVLRTGALFDLGIQISCRDGAGRKRRSDSRTEGLAMRAGTIGFVGLPGTGRHPPARSPPPGASSVQIAMNPRGQK